jgi:hypothetical protein
MAPSWCSIIIVRNISSNADPEADSSSSISSDDVMPGMSSMSSMPP